MARHSRRAADIGFDAIQIEGALIAPDMVARVAATERNAKTAADYDCPEGTNLGDEIARYFRIGQAHWQAFAKVESPTVTQTASFARILLEEAFGFDDLVGPVDHRDDGRRYRIALEAKQGRVPIVCAAPLADGDAFAKSLPEFGDGEGGRGRRSPTVLLQDWLNANPDFYWGLVFAGDRIRLMRDNASLTRPAWIEADLGAIFRDEMFADFTALWLLIHATRFGAAGTPPSSAQLEKWREEGLKQGTAARERLREGVEAALKELGQGLVAANADIRTRIERNELSIDIVFQELLRTVYRLIFLAVAEDRDLLHPPGTPRSARDLYAANYGFAYWRERSARRTAYDAHHDAWEGMKIVLAALETGQAALGLPALGGLFGSGTTPLLSAARLPNRQFLMAVYRLGFLEVNSQRTRINWRDMKTEELGSVYESLLEIRPILRPNGEFALDSGARGNARKTSGSYYTPDSLVETLLDSALDPVLDRAEAEGGADAILDLKVIDPAIGSGHFMLGAARRMADRVARLRDPDAPDTQAALRDVVGRCIYGVDRNPMAVELAKVALWIESVSPGAPLGFLDANIRCGDALLGVFSLQALGEGIPDDAYKPLTGDYKATSNGLRRINRSERDAGLLKLAISPQKLVNAFDRLHAMPESTVAEIRAKERAYRAIHGDPDWWSVRQACDAYIAAFLLPKPKLPDSTTKANVPTTRHVREALDRRPPQGALAVAIDTAANEARVFHWPVEFPDVMIGRGGFDAVLGNPPWDVVQLGEEEYFESRVPEIALLKGATRKRAIVALEVECPDVFSDFQRDKRVFDAMNEFARASGRFDFTARGKVNTYGLFAEHFLNLTREDGRAGVIVPTGIATDATTAPFFGKLISSNELRSLLSFENEEFIFPGVHHSYRFCLLTLGLARDETAQFLFFARRIEDLEDPRRRFILSKDDIERINPNTKNSPIFRSQADAALTAKIYARVPVLLDENRGAMGNPWSVEFRQGLFNMTSDSGLFRSAHQLSADGWTRSGTDYVRSEGLMPGERDIALPVVRDAGHPDLSIGGQPAEARYVPLYEAKLMHQFDHRWATFGADGVDVQDVDKHYISESFEPEPRYWLPETDVKARLERRGWSARWLMGWRDVTGAHVYRTMIAAAIPRVGTNHKLLLFFVRDIPRATCLLANFNALILDFVARQKVGGTSLGFYLSNQFPVLPPSAYTETDLAFIVPRVLELSYTSHAMAPFARDLGYDGPPFAWDDDRRARLRADLDAWYALAYGLSRDELRYVLDPKDVMGADYPSETFRVLQNNETKKYGEYRTRRLVLTAYDQLAAAAPDTSSFSDLAWEHRIDDPVDVRHILAAIIKKIVGGTPPVDVKLAALFVAKPHLLMQHLSSGQQAEWRRLVGGEADLVATPSVTSFSRATPDAFRDAVDTLRAERAIRYDMQSKTWDRGASIYRYALLGWAEGRAAFVLHAMHRIAASNIMTAIPQEERSWIAQAA